MLIYRTDIYRKDKKDSPGNHWLLSLNLVPGKIVVQVLMKASFRHLQDRKVTWPAGLYLVVVPDHNCFLR